MDEYVLKICKILELEIPKVITKDKLNTDTQMAAADMKQNKIYVKRGLHKYDLYFAIAHELRYFWQVKNGYSFDDYISTSNKEKYNLQNAEIDANAFGANIMACFFGVSALFEGLPQDIKDKIKARQKEI